MFAYKHDNMIVYEENNMLYYDYQLKFSLLVAQKMYTCVLLLPPSRQ